ncbi:hypothetical protein PRVXH_002181 [Proteinivorax hydrogeniformans]|uniref:Uncharacterized protein n=1 Tax=Proteinivorax hydrogeniformans TaxID=1826727 RepID=A0AAU8HSB7_9FIRM
MKNNDAHNKGYYIYSVFAVLGFLLLTGYVFYLVHDLLIKLSTDQFTNATAIQSVVALVITVFLGGYFSKSIEHKKHIKLEKFKSQKEISLRIIDLAGLIVREEDTEKAKSLLRNENFKVKLLFDDSTVKAINNFLEKPNEANYNLLMEEIKKFFY